MFQIKNTITKQRPKVLSINTKSKIYSPTPTPIITLVATPQATSTPTISHIKIKTTTPSPQTKKTTIAPTPTNISTNTIVSNTTSSWSIRSVSSMKMTKDMVCNQKDTLFIKKWVAKAKELGANYIAIETPYDNPACGNAVEYTKKWIDVVREFGLNVWHRHMPLSFESIYDTPKSNSSDYLDLIVNYVKNNPSFFAFGDIFTPIPEPQNGGIKGVSYCAQSICQFSGASSFNSWLRNAMTKSNTAFSEIGLSGNIKVGYWGFDGYIAWGDNNPDWSGILEDSTVSQMGNITIDHYPEAVGDTMENDLNELQKKYPTTPIIIGEWGTTQGGDTEQAVIKTMGAAKRLGVVGFNYWHMGMGGNESLINDDFSNKPQFDEVQSFYR